jgi:hypothetical protein
MEIDVIREKLSEKLDDLFLWNDILQETDPGNYGTEDVEVIIYPQDIWVDIQSRTFTFKNGNLSFCARLVSSNDEDGYNEDFAFTVSGSGEFEFIEKSKDIQINKIEINEKLDLYRGE